ncbi:hypothetical protein F0562_021755 [Nyssa sinensis]|uniref:Uncharacterized protein n=1 Tax=Nyssa sinensis TaxID=561372 RepID=A0A5J5BMV8_9ASTE|nr:hypothetical protein F0562_021755 [Nyssa sinensis]
MMLDSHADERSALAVVKPLSPSKFKGLNSNNENKGEMYRPPINEEDLWYNYCKKPRHTKEMCWKLKGKTPFGKNNNTQQRYAPRGRQANIALVDDKPIQDSTSSRSEMGELNKEEIEKLRSLLTLLDKPVGSCSLAYSTPKTLIPSGGFLSPTETSLSLAETKNS